MIVILVVELTHILKFLYVFCYVPCQLINILIGRISDVVRIRACGSDFLTLKERGSDDGYVV
jgi:hypothetical protein